MTFPMYDAVRICITMSRGKVSDPRQMLTPAALYFFQESRKRARRMIFTGQCETEQLCLPISSMSCPPE
jgi:hypothetical protein